MLWSVAENHNHMKSEKISNTRPIKIG
jgi:hypothetical protein